MTEADIDQALDAADGALGVVKARASAWSRWRR